MRKNKISFLKIFASLFFVFLFFCTKTPTAKPRATGENWYNPNWQFRKKITIDHTKVSGSDLSNFPVLIKYTDPELKSVNFGGHVGQDNGNDLSFTLSDGVSKISHEIESYSPETGTIIAWVKVPTVFSSVNTEIFVYYGNSQSVNQQNPPEVWSSNYKGVWHLNEIANGILAEFKDSTGINNGQGGAGNVSYSPQRVTGKINLAQTFDGINDFIDSKNNSSLNLTAKAITMEAWIKFDSNPTTHMGIFSKDGYTAGYRWMVRSDRKINFQLSSKSSLISSASLSAGSWYHLVATYDGTKMKIFINGQKDVTEKSKTNNITTTSDFLWIGMGDYGCVGKSWCYPFKGTIAEARISNVARTPDWILTQFNNQNSPSSFYLFSPEESSSPLPSPTSTLAPSPTIIPTPTEIPSPTPTEILLPTPTSFPAGSWTNKLTVDNDAHETYGASYPMTYSFVLPVGTSLANVYKKYSEISEWQPIPQKTSSDFFNGIEAFRADYGNSRVYVSLIFSSSSNEIYLRFENLAGETIRPVYEKVTQYYDNRKAVVVATADDWADFTKNEFTTAIANFRSRQMWLSAGIITGWTTTPTWQAIQTEINNGFVEPVSHSRTHPQTPYADYESEVKGSSEDIKNNLNLSSFNKKGTTEYVYTWLEPYHNSDAIVREKLGQSKYIADRSSWTGNYEWATFDQANNLYNQIFSTTSMDSLDEATLNQSFNTAYNTGKIYHVYFHPANIDWGAGKKAQNHLTYISGKKDVWYSGLGYVYLYHYLQDMGKIFVVSQ